MMGDDDEAAVRGTSPSRPLGQVTRINRRLGGDMAAVLRISAQAGGPCSRGALIRQKSLTYVTVLEMNARILDGYEDVVPGSLGGT